MVSFAEVISYSRNSICQVDVLYPSEQLKYSIRFRNNKRDGLFLYYSKKGHLNAIYEFDSDTLTKTVYTRNKKFNNSRPLFYKVVTSGYLSSTTSNKKEYTNYEDAFGNLIKFEMHSKEISVDSKLQLDKVAKYLTNDSLFYIII